MQSVLLFYVGLGDEPQFLAQLPVLVLVHLPRALAQGAVEAHLHRERVRPHAHNG